MKQDNILMYLWCDLKILRCDLKKRPAAVCSAPGTKTGSSDTCKGAKAVRTVGLPLVHHLS